MTRTDLLYGSVRVLFKYCATTTLILWFKRLGPNELSIADADAIPTVLGPGGLAKGRCTSVFTFEEPHV